MQQVAKSRSDNWKGYNYVTEVEKYVVIVFKKAAENDSF